MGITIHYRGTMNDISEVETMENRMLDLVFSLGGRATIWRSWASGSSSRVVRGIMIDMEPGQDTFSLLVSPEGHLTPLFQIEEAENEPFDEPPYCFVKTQFGSLQGHVAIVHLLDALRQRFCSNLEVSDEGGYYESRDVNQLAQRLKNLGAVINSLADGMRESGLSAEAAEDPTILATRIERIAGLVQKKLLSDEGELTGSKDDRNRFNIADDTDDLDNTDEADWIEPSLEEEVAEIEQLRRKNDLRSERMNRRISDAIAAGLSVEEAFELAMQEEGLANTDAADHPGESVIHEPLPTDEPWLSSLPQHEFDEASQRSESLDHPAVLQAQAFLKQAMEVQPGDSNQSSFFSILLRSSMEMVGGLVQATSAGEDDNVHRALSITQLKRAMAGHAYARGAVFGLQSEGAITAKQAEQLHEELQSMLTSIHELSAVAWS